MASNHAGTASHSAFLAVNGIVVQHRILYKSPNQSVSLLQLAVIPLLVHLLGLANLLI